MKKYKIKILIEWDPDSKLWISYVPRLNNISTYAETKEKVIQMTRDAVTVYLETAEKEDIPAILNERTAELVDIEVEIK